MIPIRLSLRNFMCYREPAEVLNLTGVHLACLAGENGAGKSALLEAMTWSLWGRARDRQIDDELISKGATDMEIDFHFALGTDHYRVIRKRLRKGNSGTTMLDVMVSESGEESSWKGISGSTVRESQARINELLKLDYETFINSAFILQGRADEFTVKNPADRKRILADILGLAQYDRLEETAKEEARLRKARMNELEGTIHQIDVQLVKRPAYAQELETVEAQLIEAQSSLTLAGAELAEIQAQKQSLDYTGTRLKELQDRQRKREASMLVARSRMDNNTARKAELEALLSQRDAIEAGYARWQEMQTEERRLTEAMAAHSRLTNEHSSLEHKIDSEKIGLDRDAANHREQIRKLGGNLAGRGVIETQLAEVLDKLRRLEQLQSQHEDTRCQRENLDVRMQTLKRELDACKEEGSQLRQKQNLLKTAHSEQGHADCPLCETVLTAEALRRVQESYDRDIKEKLQEYERKNKELEGVNKQIVAVEGKLAQEREDLKPLDMQRRREAQLRAKIASLDEDEQQLSRIESALVLVRTRLDESDYAHEARASLQAVKARIRSLAYDEDEHKMVRASVAELGSKKYDEQYHRLQNAESSLQMVVEAIEQDALDLEAWTAERLVDAEEIGALIPKLGQLAIVKGQLETKSRDVEALRTQVNSLSERRGGLRHQLEYCDGLQQDKRLHSEEYGKAVEEKTAYDELSTAFGKKGIQAMIIEGIIPEIEDEANKLLDKMTDGRMTVQFATQRDAKTGKNNVIETLDINISDEIGTRAYEMYSGGEAFRVNLAVRIALSKLLARRAGTQLQTLVIDEGFGSQDGQGREKLVAAIRSIQEDFERILVITHIEELKDEFPVRINIVKTSTGSRIIMADEMVAAA